MVRRQSTQWWVGTVIVPWWDSESAGLGGQQMQSKELPKMPYCRAWSLLCPLTHLPRKPPSQPLHPASSDTMDAHSLPLSHTGKCAEKLASTANIPAIHAQLRARFAPAAAPRGPQSSVMTLSSLWVCMVAFERSLGLRFEGAHVEVRGWGRRRVRCGCEAAHIWM